MGIKNIIMISIDALRFDCVGYQKDKRFLKKNGVLEHLDTAAFDALAERGVCFSQAITTSPYTTNSHASIFTGCYPPRHNVRAFFSTKLSPSVKTMAEILKENNYLTMHYFDGAYMFESTGLNRGIDRVTDGSDDEKFLKGLKEVSGRKVFLFAHFFDVHDPYIFSHHVQRKHGFDSEYERWKEDAGKKLNFNEELPKNPYNAFHLLRKKLIEKGSAHEVLIPAYIKGVSRFLNGRFLNFINGLKESGVLTDDSLLVIFSDHGEARYGPDFTHGGVLFEDVIRIPLVFSCPALLPESKPVDAQVSTVDILPTVLDIAGIDYSHKEFMQGRTLLPLMAGCDFYNASPAYSEYWSETIDAGLMRRRVLDGHGGLLGVSHTRDKKWQQSLRTPEHKFIFNHHPSTKENVDDILKNTEGLSNGNFIEEAYRRVLVREPDPEGFNNAKKQIDRGLGRGQFLKAIYSSLEYTNLNGDLMVDITALKGEEKWIGISEPFFSRYNDAKKIVDEICPATPESSTPEEEEKIAFTDSGEEEKVMGRLRDLGYME
ncbi:MAG: sulfatase [Thermodesulfobacteriota bacterium]